MKNKIIAFLIILFGIGLIVTSVHQMGMLIGYSNDGVYKYFFQQYPEPLISVRYIISVATRIVGIGLGIGILFRMENARKATIFFFVFIIATTSFKHPFLTVLYFMDYIDQQCLDAASRGFAMVCGPKEGIVLLRRLGIFISRNDFAVIATAITRAQEIFFATLLMLFFILTPVKEQFQKKGSNKN